MAIREYSMARDADSNISPHFKIREFACSDGSDKVLIDDDLVNQLENIRNHFGKPLHINSGYRTPSYNVTLLGASKKSQHMTGRAADIWVEGVDTLTLYRYCLAIMPGWGGIGIYNTFVHFDTRPNKSRWDYRTKFPR